MYTNMEENKVTREFKSGGLHEKHIVVTWKLGNYLSILLWSQGNQEDTGKPRYRGKSSFHSALCVGIEIVKCCGWI
jgi:hypothetical protein